MIGNDIIDLNIAKKESNWKRKGYLNKVFSKDEICFVLNQPNPELLVWLLWSMKESAYKIIHRETLIRKYEPWKLEGVVLSKHRTLFLGKIKFEKKTFLTKTIISGNILHTIAVAEGRSFDNLRIYENHLLKDKTNFLQSCLPENEYFNKDENGIPFILNTVYGIKKTASLSHHGSAIALLVQETSLPTNPLTSFP